MGKEGQKLASILRGHTLVAIDTPVFIYHFEAHLRYQKITAPIFENIESGSCSAVTSILSRLEILVRPLKEMRDDLANSYRFLLDTFPNLTQISIDREVADRAAEIRAASSMTTPDSIHLACALSAGASLFITNDSDFSKGYDGMKVLLLDSLF